MKEKQVKPEENNEDQVKLKPIMGIRPGVYLTVLYSVVLTAIIFFIFLFPGLKNPMAALVVNTEPQGAAIRVNDIYMGQSGSRIIIPQGTYTIEAVMNGFDSTSSEYKIPGRVFASNFFPRTYKIDLTLKTADPAAAFALYAADFAAWSFGGEPTEAWQIPLSLSEGAYRIGRYRAADSAENKEQLEQILLAASRFTVTRAALRDLIRAKALLDNDGNSPSPLALIGSLSDALVFLSENQGTWLSRLVPGINWVNHERAAAIPLQRQSNSAAGRIEFSGLTFARMGSLIISENPVPRSLFETFLNENPQWREHKKDYYPDEISSPVEIFNRTDARFAITGVTWYAAEAFCIWLTRRLGAAPPPSLSGMEVRLPRESELEQAALNISGWEWCADPYAPLQFIKAQDSAIQAVGSVERALFGQTRASLPPDFSSPFITFRLVIANRR
ncbi:MAG: formylglycine-generating enzyme family protein [Treponema sp.]|nr:formylglycine-generating enzyme family protein [Treponema sp.]